MAVTLDLPTTQEEIPGAIRKLREELAAAQARVKAIQGGIAAVQAMCAHPHKTSGRDYDGGGWTRCSTCGEET